MSHGYRTAPNRLDACVEPATLVSAIGGTAAGVRVLALNTEAPAIWRCALIDLPHNSIRSYGERSSPVKNYPVPETTHSAGSSDRGSTAALIPLTACSGHRGTSAASAPVAQRPVTPLDPMDARSLVGLDDLPTIVAIGPFDDRTHADQLAASFIGVRAHCKAQLVLVGTGVQCTTVEKSAAAAGFGTDVHGVRNAPGDQWSKLVAAADLVVLSSPTSTTLLDVLAAGRPVIAPDDPATVQLVVTGIAGLVYRPGDVSGMEKALLRLLMTPVLRRGMGGRATQIARRQRVETSIRSRVEEGKPI
jgi:glycosyltransferase involved in cell wall biosynthesis